MKFASGTPAHDQILIQGQPAPTPARRSTPRLQPIIAIPQIGNGQGVPFIRAYTRLLSEEYEISENDFLRFIDGLNTVVIPSVEADIAKKAIKIGSHFVPGVGALAVNIGGQAVPVIGDKLHLSYCTKHFIATANAQLFNPVGLEATLCSSANLDQFTGVQSGQEYGMDPVQRLQSYGTAILHFDELLAPAQRQGWHERVSASVAQNEAERNQQKVMQKMQRGRGKGQNKADQGEGAFKWLVIKTVGDTGCISQPQQYLGYD